MWCTQCQQDVPGIASTEGGQYCCPRCGEPLRPTGTPPGVETISDSGPRDGAPENRSGDGDDFAPAEYDGWEFQQQLDHIGQVLAANKRETAQMQEAYRQEVARLDPSHGNTAPWHTLPTDAPVQTAKRRRARPQPATAKLIWLALSLGTMTFVCGGILLGWSIATDRPELWNVGMPIALCGQIALLVGLVLQLERLWHDSRQAAAKLDNVDDRLHELKTTTTLLGTTHGPSAGAFYSHLANGAGPELLLNDLKSQLDLLAVKIMQQDE